MTPRILAFAGSTRRESFNKKLVASTANMVPVCSMTSRNVNFGEDGSMPIRRSAMMTCAELDTGSNSAAPWIRAKMAICK